MTKTYDPTPPQRVAFLGLGVMGYPMAGHLAQAGHAVTVYNRTAAKAAQWVAEHGHASAATPQAAAEGAAIVFACVGNDDDLRSVTLGDRGAFAGMAPGAVFVIVTAQKKPKKRGRLRRPRCHCWRAARYTIIRCSVPAARSGLRARLLCSLI